MHLARYPRRFIAHLPTPLERLDRLTKELGGPEIWIKRDDCTGLSTGGNKTRKLEFLMAEAELQEADVVITQGATQSNHARQTAAFAAKLGIQCHLLLEDRTGSDNANYKNNGNVLLDHLHGATTETRPGGLDMNAEMEAVAERMRAEGRKVYTIPGGGSNATGALGYVNCAFELLGQANDRGLRIDRLVPRKDVRMVLTDGGPSDFGLAGRAAEKLAELGYGNVRVLTGGTAGWKAEGFEVFSGVNVPSKAFGEYVEHWYDTPRLPAEELHSRVEAGEDIVILDSRPMTEFNRMSIPGGVDCPGAELVYRVAEMAPDPNTTIVVNCAGRTRSIIGCQSLVNAGLPNKIYALKDGTMGWNLAGYDVARGETTHAPAPSGDTLDLAKQRAAEVAARFGVTRTNAAELARWQGEAETTTYLLDVRT